MKKFSRLTAMILVMITVFSFFSCEKQSPAEKGTTAGPGSQTTAAPVDNTPDEFDQHITATIKSKSGNYEITEEGEGTVSITAEKKPSAGDVVTAVINGNYLKVQANGQSKTAIVYLPDGVFQYTMPSNASVYMDPEFKNKPFSFTFGIPTREELLEDRNIVLNPFDGTDKKAAFYPHATSSNVYDQSGQFIPRNAIDGYITNKGHGNYPYESWGPNSDVKKSDHFTVSLGREVLVSSLTLYLRADGFGSSNSHDAYFSTIVLEFSDGTKVTVNPEKTAKKQEFDFDPVMTSYVKLTGFVTDKSNSQGWAAITEVIVTGHDILD